MTVATVTLQSLWILMILSLISHKTTAATQTPTTQSTTQSPALEIKYQCYTNGNITINTTNLQPTAHPFSAYMISTSNVSLVNMISKSQGDPIPSCSTNRTNLSNLNKDTIELTNCTYGSPVYVYLMEEKNPKVIGGKNFQEFNISCHLAYEGIMVLVGTNLTLSEVDSFHSAGPTPKTKTQSISMSSISLSMSITPSTAFVGESLNVTISDKGLEAYYILPDSCSASDGSNTIGNNITLLSNGKTVDDNLVTDFTVTTTGQANTTLYAFEFPGADTVHFSCTVRVCPDINCGGNFTSYTSTTTTAKPTTTPTTPATAAPAGRRRRSGGSNHGNHVTTVQTTFRVLKQHDQNNKKTTNGSNKISTCLMCYTTTVILLLTGYLRHQS